MYFSVYCRNVINHNLSNGSSSQEVYYGAVQNLTDKLPFLISLLSDAEKERASHFKHESDFNCYVTVHALLRMELSKLLKTDPGSVPISRSEHGKPFIRDTDMSFSLSRSENEFVFVIGNAKQSLGVDIEQIKTSIDFVQISRNYFSEAEQRLVLLPDGDDDQNRTFFEIWTRKEAFLKAIGIGIATELSEVNVLEGSNRIKIGEALNETDTFRISTIYHNMAYISIASSSDFTPRLIDLSL